MTSSIAMMKQSRGDAVELEGVETTAAADQAPEQIFAEGEVVLVATLETIVIAAPPIVLIPVLHTKIVTLPNVPLEDLQ